MKSLANSRAQRTANFWWSPLPFTPPGPIGRNANDWGMGTTKLPEVSLISLTPLLLPAWGKQISQGHSSTVNVFCVLYLFQKCFSSLSLPLNSRSYLTWEAKRQGNDVYISWHFWPCLNAIIGEKSGLLQNYLLKSALPTADTDIPYVPKNGSPF